MDEIHLGSFTPLLIDDVMKLIFHDLAYKQLVSLRCVSKSWLDCPKYTSEHWFDSYVTKEYYGDKQIAQKNRFFMKNFAKSAKLKDYHNLEERLVNNIDLYGEKVPYSLNHIFDVDEDFLYHIQYDDASLEGFLHFYYLESGNIEGLDIIRSREYVCDSETPSLLKRASELNNKRMFIYCLKSFLEYDNNQGPILINWPKNMEYERKVIEKYFDCHWYGNNPVDCTLGPGNYVVFSTYNSYINSHLDETDDEYIIINGTDHIFYEYVLKKIDILLGPPYTQQYYEL
uniref:F-box domain protein n=1 Tax=Pithovirus LCPAC101 TaxID=2506586 RepID=A0A481Z2B1_9VIRU|nr:MAG: F-box domain protein [Pithovirus LCPAC101]